jgi:hypothetical protein
MRVFLDDVRPTPSDWVRAYVPEEVITHLETGDVEEISLDYDLGFRGKDMGRTGERVLQWLEQQIFIDAWTTPIPDISIHSANVVGRSRLVRARDSVYRLAERKGLPRRSDAS